MKAKTKNTLIIGGIIATLLGIGAAIFLVSKPKKEDEIETDESPIIDQSPVVEPVQETSVQSKDKDYKYKDYELLADMNKVKAYIKGTKTLFKEYNKGEKIGVIQYETATSYYAKANISLRYADVYVSKAYKTKVRKP